MKIIHYFKVALHFSIFTEEFWLALCHDLVEDGYLGTWACKWQALDAITRRENEIYMTYIERVSSNKKAINVKIADLRENMKRCNACLTKRYLRAFNFLTTRQYERTNPIPYRTGKD